MKCKAIFCLIANIKYLSAKQRIQRTNTTFLFYCHDQNKLMTLKIFTRVLNTIIKYGSNETINFNPGDYEQCYMRVFNL